MGKESGLSFKVNPQSSKCQIKAAAMRYINNNHLNSRRMTLLIYVHSTHRSATSLNCSHVVACYLFNSALSRSRNKITSPNGVRLVFHYCIFFLLIFFIIQKWIGTPRFSDVFEGLKLGCPGKIGTLGRYAIPGCDLVWEICSNFQQVDHS